MTTVPIKPTPSAARQQPHVQQRTFWCPSIPIIMVCTAAFALIGASFIIQEWDVITDGEGSLILLVLVVGFMSAITVIGTYATLRAPFLRVTVKGDTLTEYGPLKKHCSTVTAAEPATYDGGVLPCWAPLVTTDAGEEHYLLTLARYGNPFTGKPARGVVHICNVINHSIEATSTPCHVANGGAVSGG